VGRNRLIAMLVVGGALALLHHLVPKAAERASWLYLVALPIGYGHLLGGLLFARARFRSTTLESAFLGVTALVLLGVYLWALQVDGLRFAVLVPMLLLSAWHIVENDLSLARSYRDALRQGGLPRDLRHHALALAGTLGIGLLALTTPTGGFYLRWGFGAALPWQWATIADLATAVLLYHAVSWILFFLDRARSLPAGAARRLRARLWWLHATPLAVNAALYVGWSEAHLLVASPVLYLFWSVLHALQTGMVRGLAPGNAA